MIRSNLRSLLAQRGLTALKVSKDTGISRTTLSSLVQNNAQGIQFETLNTLSRYLRISPGELFLFVPFDIEFGELDSTSSELPFVLTDSRSRVRECNVVADIQMEEDFFDLVDGDNIARIKLPIALSITLGSELVKDEPSSLNEKIFLQFYWALPFEMRLDFHASLVSNLSSGLYKYDDSSQPLTREQLRLLSEHFQDLGNAYDLEIQKL